MKNLIVGAMALVCASLLCACATGDVGTKDEPREEKQYVTGSNLPKKDRSGVVTVSKEALERAMQDAAGGTAPAMTK